jgi:PAS domain-containing protein
MKKKVTASLEKSSDFESFLGELSAELVNLPLESIDGAIESSMKKLVDFFDADRCHIGEIIKEQSKIVVSYFYSRPSINEPQITEVGEHYLSFIYRSIKEEKILSFNETSEIPEHSKKDRDVIEGLGIQSLLVVPLKINDDVRFGLSLSTVGRKHQWDPQSIGRIMIIGNILVNTMQRRLFLDQINMEKEWSEAVIEGMPQFAYVYDLQGRLKRWNKKLEDLLGYTPDEMKDKFIGDFMASEEDLKRVFKEIEKVIGDGHERSV